MKVRMKRILPWAAGALIAAAGIYWFLGRPGEPDRTEIDLYFHAVRAYERGDLSRAIALAGTLCKRNPGFFQARLLLAKAYFFRDRYTEAEQHLRKILKDHDACAEAHIWLLRTLVQEEKLDEARIYGEKLLAYSPRDPRILGLLAGLAYTGGAIQKALEYYTRAILFEEEMAIHRIELAKIYIQLLNIESAALHLQKALGLLPEGSPMASAVVQLLDQCREAMPAMEGTE